MKNWLNLGLCLVFFIAQTSCGVQVREKVKEEEKKKKEHPFVSIYQEFMQTDYQHQVKSTKTAVLFNTDEEDDLKMLTFYASNDPDPEKAREFQNIEYHYMIYYYSHGVQTEFNHNDDTGYNIDDVNFEHIYLSKKGYIIHETYDDNGPHYRVIGIMDGGLYELFSLTHYVHEPIDEHDEHYSVTADDETTRLNGREYDRYRDEYGVSQVAKVLMSDSSVPANSDETEILRMTDQSLE